MLGSYIYDVSMLECDHAEDFSTFFLSFTFKGTITELRNLVIFVWHVLMRVTQLSDLFYPPLKRPWSTCINSRKVHKWKIRLFSGVSKRDNNIGRNVFWSMLKSYPSQNKSTFPDTYLCILCNTSSYFATRSSFRPILQL